MQSGDIDLRLLWRINQPAVIKPVIAGQMHSLDLDIAMIGNDEPVQQRQTHCQDDRNAQPLRRILPLLYNYPFSCYRSDKDYHLFQYRHACKIKLVLSIQGAHDASDRPHQQGAQPHVARLAVDISRTR